MTIFIKIMRRAFSIWLGKESDHFNLGCLARGPISPPTIYLGSSGMDTDGR
jgi:hypothetical protein